MYQMLKTFTVCLRSLSTHRAADAPWCGHCQKLAPEYTLAASKLAEEKSTVRLAKIDAALYRDVAEKFSVSHYPTLKLYIDSIESFVCRLPERTASSIVVWLKKRLAKYPANFVHSVQTAHKSISSNQLVAFAFFKASNIILLSLYSLLCVSFVCLRFDFLDLKIRRIISAVQLFLSNIDVDLSPWFATDIAGGLGCKSSSGVQGQNPGR